jgi:hypothetical protein
METIKATVNNIIKDLLAKKDDALKVGGAEGFFKNALTKKELGHIKFNYFRKGILSVNVDSSPWLYKLSLQKAKLLLKLQKGISNIKDIRFRIGEIK